MNFGGTLVIRNMLKIALAILASLVKFQDCLHCLEARTDFVFLLATNTRQLWLVFTFFPKISSWHKIQVMALLRQAVRSVAQAGCFQTSAWWVFFSMQSTFCHSSSFLAGPCPACSSTRPCVVSITTVFFGFNIFASNTDQTCNCCLLTVQRSDAILVGLFIVPTRVCVIKVACSCVIIGYARMQCIITGWTTYIF